MPRSATIDRSPSGVTSEQITPLRPSTGPCTSTPSAASRARAIAPASSLAGLPDEAGRMRRALPPRLRRSPPARRARGRSRRPCRRPTAIGSESRTMTSSVRSPSVQTSIGTIVRSGVDGSERRGGVRAFLLGGLVGASAAVAAINRRRRAQRRRGRPRGLAAFESAPCYLELLEQERDPRPARAVAGASLPAHVPIYEYRCPTGTPSRSSSGCPTRRRRRASRAAPGRWRRSSSRSRCTSRARASTRRTTAAGRRSEGRRVRRPRRGEKPAADKPAEKSATDTKPKPSVRFELVQRRVQPAP